MSEAPEPAAGKGTVGQRLFLGRLPRPLFILCVVAVAVALAAAAAQIYRMRRESNVFFLHSASDLYAQYAGRLASPGTLPAASASVDAASSQQLAKLYGDDFYVVKDGSTDCSFVAVLMLMLRRDPGYPLRVVRETPDGYVVRFPAAASAITVTRDDLRVHHDNWKDTRETYRRLWPGHIPEGLEILRTAYYNYQAQVGTRGSKGKVHGGGIPSQDLIILSGARSSLSVMAHCPDLPRREAATFDTCPGILVETRLGADGRFTTAVKGGLHAIDNPLDAAGNPESHLTVVSASSNVPAWRGPRIVPNHAYYYLGKTPDGQYVLGNSYQTRRPIVVTPGQFRRYFRAIDFVELPVRLAPS